MRISLQLSALGLLLAGCEAPPLIERGGKCHSLSDCELALTCVAGRCSDDVSSLRGEVPSYEQPDTDAALDAALEEEAGVRPDAQVLDAMAARPDAAAADAGSPDASGSRDASSPDGSTTLPDAALPDAASDAMSPDTGADDAAEPDSGEPEDAADVGSVAAAARWSAATKRQ